MAERENDIGQEYVPPPDGYYKEHNDYICVCSCGKQSLVKYDGRKKHYVAVEKGWTYTPISTIGWTCGEEGHRRGDNTELGFPADRESFRSSFATVPRGNPEDGDEAAEEEP